MLYSTLCAPLSSATAQTILSNKTPTRLQPSPPPSSVCFPPTVLPPPELGCGKRLAPSAEVFGARGQAKHWFCGAVFVEETSMWSLGLPSDCEWFWAGLGWPECCDVTGLEGGLVTSRSLASAKAAVWFVTVTKRCTGWILCECEQYH